MGFYDTSYGGVSRSLYEDQEFDSQWNSECQFLLQSYVEKYAPFHLAMLSRFVSEVFLRFHIKLKAHRIETNILKKAYGDTRLRSIWESRYAKYENMSFQCVFCDKTIAFVNLEPSVLASAGMRHLWCRRCDYDFRHYGKIWSEDLKERIMLAKKTAGEKRFCNFCGNSFNLLRRFFDTRSFNDDEGFITATAWDEKFTLCGGGVDFLYPNLFLDICPSCFENCFSQNKIITAKQPPARALFELGSMIGKIPTRDFDSYIYLFNCQADIHAFLKIMQVLPSPSILGKYYGSFFKALIVSGLLPDGTQKMKIGTRVLAKDEDLCFSIQEKDIDDYLSAHAISHRKEAVYPNSSMRCDWEIFNFSQRIFIEYWGLSNIPEYQRKMESKRMIAAQNNIKLLELYPGQDWKTFLDLVLSKL